ncbi:hypothetical protein FOMPIDRAFT_1130197, partial [Fomitopsis schrenkii]
MDTLCLPVAEGGLGLLDLQARNEAIELTWVKRYLDLSPARPMWAWAVDVLLSKHATSDAGAISRKAQVNSFLQSWSPAVGARSTLPQYLKSMLRTAKKHDVSFAAIKLSKRTKMKLPIWYHLGSVRKLRAMNNSPAGKCLRDHHDVKYVADLLPLRDRGCTLPSVGQGPSRLCPSCPCADCSRDRARSCRNPQRCCLYAASLLDQIRPKWHPDVEAAVDGLSLTSRRKAKNAEATPRGGDLLFDPTVTSDEPLEESLRVFVDPAVHDHPPAIRRRAGRTVAQEARTIY